MYKENPSQLSQYQKDLIAHKIEQDEGANNVIRVVKKPKMENKDDDFDSEYSDNNPIDNVLDVDDLGDEKESEVMDDRSESAEADAKSIPSMDDDLLDSSDEKDNTSEKKPAKDPLAGNMGMAMGMGGGMAGAFFGAGGAAQPAPGFGQPKREETPEKKQEKAKPKPMPKRERTPDVDEAIEFSSDDDEMSSPEEKSSPTPVKAPNTKRSADLEHERVKEPARKRSPPREMSRPSAPTHAREPSRDEESEEEAVYEKPAVVHKKKISKPKSGGRKKSQKRVETEEEDTRNLEEVSSLGGINIQTKDKKALVSEKITAEQLGLKNLTPAVLKAIRDRLVYQKIK